MTFGASKLTLIDIFPQVNSTVLTLGNLALTLSKWSVNSLFYLYVVVMLCEIGYPSLETDPLECIRMLISDFKSSTSGAPLFSRLVPSFVFPPHQHSSPCLHLWTLLLLAFSWNVVFSCSSKPSFHLFLFAVLPRMISTLYLTGPFSLVRTIYTVSTAFPRSHGFLYLQFTQGILNNLLRVCFLSLVYF